MRKTERETDTQRDRETEKDWQGHRAVLFLPFPKPDFAGFPHVYPLINSPFFPLVT